MPSKFVKPLKVIIFAALCIVVFNTISSVCIPRWYMPWMSTANVSAVNTLPEETVDVAVFGSSAGIRSFSPLELWTDYGISGYNFSTEQQPIMGAYYILKDLLKHQSPKVVVVEAWELIGYSDEGFYRKSFDNLNLSFDKLEAAMIHSGSESADSFFSYAMPILKYHTNWKTLNKYSFSKFQQEKFPQYYRGFVMNAEHSEIEFDGWVETGQQTAVYNAEGLYYLTQLVNLCRQNDIALILYKCPFIDNMSAHNAIQKFADLHEIPFIDFHMKDVIEMSGLDYSRDIDGGQHDNTAGAAAITRYLGKYITENYDVPDHREDPSFAYLYEEVERYEHEKKNESFLCENTLSDYLRLLLDSSQSNYTALLSIAGKVTENMEEDITAKIAELGFKTDFYDMNCKNFLGIWQNGKVVWEEVSEGDPIEYSGAFLDETKYYIKSTCNNVCDIIINGDSISAKSSGIYIAIYDNMTSRLVDSICWNVSAENELTAAR